MIEELLAYFITWSCYGTYLPGDERGWTKWRKGEQLPQPFLEDWCRDQMSETAVLLDRAQREIVEQAIRDHCEVRGWKLLAVNCRSNHCHLVVAAPNHRGEQVRDQLKAWATRRLKQHQQPFSANHGSGRAPALRCDGNANDAAIREHWWTRKGSVRHLFDDKSVDAAVMYTLEAQDQGGSKRHP